jgi:hypothetical protein
MVSLSFVGNDVHHKAAISDNFAFWFCLAWYKENCVGSFNLPPNALGQASKFVCCCSVPDLECGFILYELAILQTGASVLVDDSIGHRNMVNGVLGGCRKHLGVCQWNGAENMWSMMLSVVCWGFPYVPPQKCQRDSTLAGLDAHRGALAADG